ncbi:unnamed protein product [Arctogadus glacialis]
MAAVKAGEYWFRLRAPRTDLWSCHTAIWVIKASPVKVVHFIIILLTLTPPPSQAQESSSDYGAASGPDGAATGLPHRLASAGSAPLPGRGTGAQTSPRRRLLGGGERAGCLFKPPAEWKTKAGFCLPWTKQETEGPNGDTDLTSQTTYPYVALNRVLFPPGSDAALDRGHDRALEEALGPETPRLLPSFYPDRAGLEGFEDRDPSGVGIITWSLWPSRPPLMPGRGRLSL